MQVIRAGTLEYRKKDFRVSRPNNLGYYTFQLFWTPMYFKINGKAVVTPPNTIILFQPSDAQYFHAAEQMMTNDYVVFSATKQETAGLIFNKPLSVSNSELFHNWIQYIYADFYSANLFRTETTTLFLQALLYKCREIYAGYENSKPFAATDERLLQLHASIRNGSNQKWTIRQMAELCNLSPSRFQTVYKQLFNISPMADVLNVRMITAKHLLKSSVKSIKQIAAEVGYDSDVHFMMQFKKRTGITPSQYRKLYSDLQKNM